MAGEQRIAVCIREYTPADKPQVETLFLPSMDDSARESPNETARLRVHQFTEHVISAGGPTVITTTAATPPKLAPARILVAHIAGEPERVVGLLSILYGGFSEGATSEVKKITVVRDYIRRCICHALLDAALPNRDDVIRPDYDCV
jgi:hypothetical protein